MKKLKFVCFTLITIFLLVLNFAFVKVEVFASEIVDGYADDWFNHISQFEYGIARCEVKSPLEFDLSGEIFFLVIDEEPANEFTGFHIEYGSEDLGYFEPELQYVFQDWLDYDFYYEDFATQIEMVTARTDFDGFLYWNFEEQYWQIDYYADYYAAGFANDWFNYISRIDYGVTRCEVKSPPEFGFEYPYEEIFFLVIKEEPTDAVINYYYEYGSEDLNYFEPQLQYVLQDWLDFEFYYEDFTTQMAMVWSQANFDGFLYWNYEEQYWQVDYYEAPDPDYYLRLIENLQYELYLKELTINRKNNEIDILEEQNRNLQNLIQELQDFIGGEWENVYQGGYYEGFQDGKAMGYDEGLMVGASEAYEEGFKAGQKSKLAENNAAFYQGIEKWLVPAIITVIALGGFVTIAARKRRDE